MAVRVLASRLRLPAAPDARGAASLAMAAAGAAASAAALVARGLGELARLALRAWARTPADRRLPILLAVAAAGVLVWLLPRGPLWAALALLTAAVVVGQRAASAGKEAAVRSAEEAAAEAAEQGARLQTVYEALVPHFCAPDDAGTGGDAMYAYGGDWERGFEEHGFRDGRLVLLRLRYPAYFPDGDPSAREAVERLLGAKAGRDRESRFRWDEERNRLELAVLEPLPTGICAQRFVTAPGETVLGFTDAGSVDRTVPVCDSLADGRTVDAAPVVWRTGPHAQAAHLLVAGDAGSGTTSLLRSVALQALAHGDLLLLDGSGAGEFACFAGRSGVLAVESAPAQMAAALEWAALETERRLAAVSRARYTAGLGRAEQTRPLWVVVDRPALLSHRAQLAGVPDPQRLLEVPLRYGRAGEITVVVGEHLSHLSGVSAAVLAGTAARVALGELGAERVAEVLGAPPGTTPPRRVPPGRGYARVAAGPVHRLQVPATPDPYDETGEERQREAVLALLPQRPVSLERQAPCDDGPEPVGPEAEPVGPEAEPTGSECVEAEALDGGRAARPGEQRAPV